VTGRLKFVALSRIVCHLKTYTEKTARYLYKCFPKCIRFLISWYICSQ